MNAKQIEVHRYYKASRPEALILYHLPGQYVVLGDDVARASKSIPTIQIVEPEVGILPDDISILSELGEDGLEVHLVSCRNGQGRLDFPNIQLLNDEKEADY